LIIYTRTRRGKDVTRMSGSGGMYLDGNIYGFGYMSILVNAGSWKGIGYLI